MNWFELCTHVGCRRSRRCLFVIFHLLGELRAEFRPTKLTTLGLVSTWVGDRLRIYDAVDFDPGRGRVGRVTDRPAVVELVE